MPAQFKTGSGVQKDPRGSLTRAPAKTSQKLEARPLSTSPQGLLSRWRQGISRFRPWSYLDPRWRSHPDCAGQGGRGGAYGCPRPRQGAPWQSWRSQRRLLLLQPVRWRVARGLQRRKLEQCGAAARAGPLEGAPAVHTARRRRPRVCARQSAAFQPRPRRRPRLRWRPRPQLEVRKSCGSRVVRGGRGRGRSERARGLLGGGRYLPRGRASCQRHVRARVTCAWTQAEWCEAAPWGPQPAGRSPRTCC